jgi:mitochondrial fission process protein 1
MENHNSSSKRPNQEETNTEQVKMTTTPPLPPSASTKSSAVKHASSSQSCDDEDTDVASAAVSSTLTRASTAHISATTSAPSSTLYSSLSSNTNYNIFRDSPIRYLGYANEVGESFRYQFPHFVRPSYALAFGYCLADAASSGWHVYSSPNETESHNNNNNNNNNTARTYETALAATADTLLWQCLASVMIPGATINAIVKATRLTVMAVAASASAPRSPLGAAVVVAKEWTPTLMGLGSIPFIIHPIDASVDYALDNTTRRWWPLSKTT